MNVCGRSGDERNLRSIESEMDIRNEASNEHIAVYIDCNYIHQLGRV